MSYKQLPNGPTPENAKEYHYKIWDNVCTINKAALDSATEIVVSKIGGRGEYQSTKIQDLQFTINRLLEVVGDQENKIDEKEERIIKLEESEMMKDNMVSWMKSKKKAQEGLVVKGLPFAVGKLANIPKLATRKTALCAEMKEIFNIRCNPEEFKGIRLSKGSGGSYGDMMQVYFFEQKTIEMILDAYFAQLYIDEKKKD